MKRTQSVYLYMHFSSLPWMPSFSFCHTNHSKREERQAFQDKCKKGRYSDSSRGLEPVNLWWYSKLPNMCNVLDSTAASKEIKLANNKKETTDPSLVKQVCSHRYYGVWGPGVGSGWCFKSSLENTAGCLKTTITANKDSSKLGLE